MMMMELNQHVSATKADNSSLHEGEIPAPLPFLLPNDLQQCVCIFKAALTTVRHCRTTASVAAITVSMVLVESNKQQTNQDRVDSYINNIDLYIHRSHIQQDGQFYCTFTGA